MFVIRLRCGEGPLRGPPTGTQGSFLFPPFVLLLLPITRNFVFSSFSILSSSSHSFWLCGRSIFEKKRFRQKVISKRTALKFKTWLTLKKQDLSEIAFDWLGKRWSKNFTHPSLTTNTAVRRTTAKTLDWHQWSNRSNFVFCFSDLLKKLWQVAFGFD